MDRKRQSALRKYMETIAPEEGELESMAEEDRVLESIEAADDASDEEKEEARAGLERMRRGEDVTEEQADALEAIVLPKERPVVDVEDDSYRAPGWPFEHLDEKRYRKQIEGAIPYVGRIAVPGHPTLPYAGTGFVVGPDLLMTNRHVAELFARGLGLRGLSFRSGLAADVDFKKELRDDEERLFEIRAIQMIHPYWDMALLTVRGLDNDESLVLSTVHPEDLVGRDVAVIGYPALDPRNNVELQNRIFRRVFNVKRMQPGKVRGRGSIRSFGSQVDAMTHDSSTLGGNSGSAVVDVETGHVVALHFAGRYLEANYAVPARELARDGRVVRAGVTFAESIARGATPWERAWRQADAPSEAEDRVPEEDATALQTPAADGGTVSIPFVVTVRLGEGGVQGLAPQAVGVRTDAGSGVEKMVEPFREENYERRKGYDERFLGKRLKMPKVLNKKLVSKMDSGAYIIPYEHFSIVMHKERRLALLTAANVDGRPDKRRPDPRKKYTRRALSGLGRNDQEKWFLDPRIPAVHQLPDRFFTRDRGSFDKGHLVRRNDVTWGETYPELRRANGDTYHVTNCSPQVAGFNRSNLDGLWGELENLILEQSESEDERYSVFAGPVLDADDPLFRGRDMQGDLFVQVPTRYWKVVVSREDGGLRSFAFLLEQDLSDTDLELAVSAEWRSHMIGIGDLEDMIGDLRFPDAIHDADQIDSDFGERVRAEGGMGRTCG